MRIFPFGQDYQDFLNSKVMFAENNGMQFNEFNFNKNLYEYQKDVIRFGIEGGQRAFFLKFGRGKTFIALETARLVIEKTKKPFLIVCPLGVTHEFRRNIEKFEMNMDIIRITNTSQCTRTDCVYITNYERVRKGDIDPTFFGGVVFDEAARMRNLKSKITSYMIEHFSQIEYRFVATATPNPNDHMEILNYAYFLGVGERDMLLTKFFQRDPKKAGNLKLHEHKRMEFWEWVSTWAAFLSDPEDLGYEPDHRFKPKLNIIEHIVDFKREYLPVNRNGETVLFGASVKSSMELHKDKRDSLSARMQKAYEIAESLNNESVIIWHLYEPERKMLEKLFAGKDYRSVWGSLDPDEKESRIVDFADGKYKILLTKPSIAGSGCNFQTSHNMIFASIDYNFHDFIQAVYREWRPGQEHDVNCHVVFTKEEYEIWKLVKEKWERHNELEISMKQLIKEHGLGSSFVLTNLERKMFKENGKVYQDSEKDPRIVYVNGDCIKETKKLPSNSIGLYFSSFPFGNQYGYSENFNDFGHNENNDRFFEQCDYLTPELYRTLIPGRILAVHVKDRVLYSHQTDVSFTTLSNFSDECVRVLTKEHIYHESQMLNNFVQRGILSEVQTKDRIEELKKMFSERFHFLGKIIVTTDVVSENNQTYRLGWSEQCKDATKMGNGMAEYVLIFRKPPSTNDNAYGDIPVFKNKSEYTRGKWQLDAHGYWRSSGDRLLASEEIGNYEVSQICQAWKEKNSNSIYDYQEHVKLTELLDESDKLSSRYMVLPVHSNTENVMTDIMRVNTLNANQVSKKKEKHICPLQLDLTERIINRFSNKGDIVGDPFGGIGSIPYTALKLDRRAWASELNTQYYADGVFYCKSVIDEMTIPTFFDLEKLKAQSGKSEVFEVKKK